MPTSRGPAEGIDCTAQEVGADGGGAAADEPDAIDILTIEETIKRAHGVSRGQPPFSTLVDLEARLRGHLAVLGEPARKAADQMWHGGVKWYRHITRLDGIERQAAQELSPLPFTALIEVQLMARDCQWLLDGYKENWR
ncbi:DUF6415 family natural product biosynthesis protein [Streptomyces sioyaensis]|uniref:DUF6415 family natural product biosynthesis protein n=1 Tax=Streptomyces sioyaensis TaxID=67364 RepID=UPI0036E4F68F